MASTEKEYINKTTGEYRKTSDVVSGEQWIEIPSGAKCLTKCVWLDEQPYLIWWKGGFKKCIGSDNDWVKVKHSVLEYLKDVRSSVLWTRAAKPKELPFVDDEPSLNEEIEKVRQAIKVKSGSNSDHIEDAMSYGFIGIADTLAARQATYGSFEDVACVTQDLLAILKRTGLDSLPKPHKEALHMICSKIARIVNGDFNHKDSWHDIGGYAKLIEDLID